MVRRAVPNFNAVRKRIASKTSGRFCAILSVVVGILTELRPPHHYTDTTAATDPPELLPELKRACW